MADIFMLLVYVGGAFAWSRKYGFWSALVWPCPAAEMFISAALDDEKETP
jgi:hypothetical protein